MSNLSTQNTYQDAKPEVEERVALPKETWDKVTPLTHHKIRKRFEHIRTLNPKFKSAVEKAQNDETVGKRIAEVTDYIQEAGGDPESVISNSLISTFDEWSKAVNRFTDSVLSLEQLEGLRKLNTDNMSMSIEQKKKICHDLGVDYQLRQNLVNNGFLINNHVPDDLKTLLEYIKKDKEIEKAMKSFLSSLGLSVVLGGGGLATMYHIAMNSPTGRGGALLFVFLFITAPMSLYAGYEGLKDYGVMMMGLSKDLAQVLEREEEK